MSAKYIVRYGSMRNLGEFTAKGTDEYQRNCEVIVRSDRGVEWGEVLCDATENTREYLGEKKVVGKILRRTTLQDEDQRDRAQKTELEEFRGCQEMIDQRKLQMQLVDVEHIFGGERFGFLLPRRETSRLPRIGQGLGQTLSNANRDAANRRAATRRSCWPITATVASRSVAIRT